MSPRSARHARRPTRSLPSRQQGFTLLDLLIALTILGIVFGIALPAFDHAVARVRAGGARAALTTTLFDAQRHATVLGREVVVCPAANDQCIGGRDWGRGWIAFIDDNGDRLRGPGEQIVRREPELAPGVRLLGSVGRPRVVYQPNGGNAGANNTWTLCDRRGADDALSLILSNGARLRSDRPSPSAAEACAAGL
ncbi:MAG: GspH/FimT family pseudopilin [Pseudomonadota bacterium]